MCLCVCTVFFSSVLRLLLLSFCICISSKQRHNKLWHPDADCEMSEGQQAQCCGGEEGGHLTPEPGMSPCCEEALSDKGAACPSPRRAVALEIDPAYNNYYFRRLSDSALDSEPSTPVRLPSSAWRRSL